MQIEDDNREKFNKKFPKYKTKNGLKTLHDEENSDAEDFLNPLLSKPMAGSVAQIQFEEKKMNSRSAANLDLQN